MRRNLSYPNRFRTLVAIAVTSWTFAAQAQVYRCSAEPGKIVYQEMPCTLHPNVKEEKTEWSTERQRAAELKMQREKEEKARQ